MTRITYFKPAASGKRTGWAVAVTGLDRTQKYRKALIGDYLPEGQQIELPEGQLVVEIVPCGSVKNGHEGVRFYRATGPDLTRITWAGENDLPNWRADHLDVLDRIEELLTESTTTPTSDDQHLRAADRISELYDETCQQVKDLQFVVCAAALDKLQEAIAAIERAISLQVDHDMQQDREERAVASRI